MAFIVIFTQKASELAEDLRESTKLPFEKLQEDLHRIDQLVKEGKITQVSSTI